MITTPGPNNTRLPMVTPICETMEVALSSVFGPTSMRPH